MDQLTPEDKQHLDWLYSLHSKSLFLIGVAAPVALLWWAYRKTPRGTTFR